MNPTRPPMPPYSGRSYSSEAMPNPLYSVHVNAAVAGLSTQHPRPHSNSSPTSFYSSHLVQQHQAQLPPPLPTKPAPLAPLPPSLLPGGAGRQRPGHLSSLESSLFFQPSMTPLAPPLNTSTCAMPHPYARSGPSSSRPSLPPEPRVQTQTSVTPISDGSAPKIPPKPFLESIQKPTVALALESPVSADEQELVARAMELSLREAGPVSHADLEDEILARVLEESKASISPSTTHDAPARHISSAARELEMQSHPEPPSESSSSAPCSSRSLDETPPTSSYSPWNDTGQLEQRGLRNTSAETDLEILTKQEQNLIRSEDEARRRQLEMDEEFARSIALLEENNASTPEGLNGLQSSCTSDGVSRTPLSNTAPGSRRPSSSRIIPATYRHSLATLHMSLPIPPSIPSDTRPLPTGAPPSPFVPFFKQIGRSVSAQASIPGRIEGATSSRGVSVFPIVPPNETRPTGGIPVQHRQDSASSEGSPTTPRDRPKLGLEGLKHALGAGEIIVPPIREEVGENDNVRHDLSPIMSPITAEELDEGRMVSNASPLSPPIVEEELLLGVSFGFNAPSLSLANEPMQGPIPNIMTLPYGKCPPLHIQAPSWKQLLKLLTRLSDSRIEPTVEALAGTKSELKLRTVLQFMKVHHSTADWRTIVYLTIDVPAPPSTPNAFKYTNGDVNTLPYTYTMSPLPALLRAGAGDSNLSKCFTVPATSSTSYPALPITLPDFAMYLLAVLEDSRRTAGDSSGSLRKLAKMVDTLYPADTLEGLGPEPDVPDKMGVGQFFRRALGRGNRESHNQRGGNSERYEFITPFRIDEYR